MVKQIRPPRARAPGRVVQHRIQFVAQPIGEREIAAQLEFILREEIVACGAIAAAGIADKLQRGTRQAFREVHQRIRNHLLVRTPGVAELAIEEKIVDSIVADIARLAAEFQFVAWRDVREIVDKLQRVNPVAGGIVARRAEI